MTGTYKYAAAGHDVGTLTNDSLSAVAGRVGALPPTVPVRVFATDRDTGAKRSLVTNVADESGVDQPFGTSILSLLAPLAVLQAGGSVLGGSPARLSGRGCFAISFAELQRRARFCNRYVTNTRGPAGRQRARSVGGSRPAAGAVADRRLPGLAGSRDRRRGEPPDPARAAPGVPARRAAAAAGARRAPRARHVDAPARPRPARAPHGPPASAERPAPRSAARGAHRYRHRPRRGPHRRDPGVRFRSRRNRRRPGSPERGRARGEDRADRPLRRRVRPPPDPRSGRLSVPASRRTATRSCAFPAGRTRRSGSGAERRQPSWNLYTTPVGASAAASIRGSVSSSSRANTSVLAAISSSRRSTGVASAWTPFA